MKAKILILSTILSFFSIGCKNDKSFDSSNQPDSNEDKGFTVTLNVTVKKNDNFSIFYTEDGSTDFTKIQPVWFDLKGSDSPQNVVFKLPEDVVPTQIRLDFGINKEQEPILINNFKMSYYGKSFQVSGDKFYIYFDPDKSNTVFDREKRTVDGLRKNGNRLFPSFYPNVKPLGDEIKKLTK